MYVVLGYVEVEREFKLGWGRKGKGCVDVFIYHNWVYAIRDSICNAAVVAGFFLMYEKNLFTADAPRRSGHLCVVTSTWLRGRSKRPLKIYHLRKYISSIKGKKKILDLKMFTNKEIREKIFEIKFCFFGRSAE